ncbi:UDP-N-acetylglucosamine 2-epimerase (non-hydrolyzing) [Flavobacteriaceae bacterium]|nr:UDP-N-acetylglucosamine 2-epimerase (non-hydrolyzing) [Flavobacteriaceae bacterium]
MIKIFTIIGARPQIIKAAAISRVIKNKYSKIIEEVIIHTGQHYDANMSKVFFDELKIPKPTHNLNIGSGKHGEQIAKMIIGIENLLEEEKPNYILIYGDTNSTLSGAIAASKIQIPIIHIEAGLRSYNKNMPEEINRILSDHVSSYLFPPTETGMDNLKKEGFSLNNKPPFSFDNPAIFNFGDIMYDNSMYFSEIAEKKSNILSELNINNEKFILTTIHRNNNTDDPKRLNDIFRSLLDISNKYNLKVILPLHPRTLKQKNLYLSNDLSLKVNNSSNIIIIEPVSFLDMIQLEKKSELIITDSGGVQKEAFFFDKPCLILRPETEWVEIIESGAAELCDADYDKIIRAFDNFINKKIKRNNSLYGNGNASVKILELILSSTSY